MKRCSTLLGGAFLVLAPGSALAQDAAADRYGEQKVVYHINYAGGEEDRAYRAAMTNIQNHIDAVGGAENIDVKVVLHGDGIGLLMMANENELLQSQIGGLKGQEVDFVICNNTLTGRDIALDSLYDAWEEDVVPSGVAEVSHLQAQGYTYIKP